MDLEELQKKLIAAARATPPDDRTPYLFERRVMAALAVKPITDAWCLWGRALWRAAAPCVAISVFLGVWTLFSLRDPLPGDNVATDLETTVLAPVATLAESW